MWQARQILQKAKGPERCFRSQRSTQSREPNACNDQRHIHNEESGYQARATLCLAREVTITIPEHRLVPTWWEFGLHASCQLLPEHRRKMPTSVAKQAIPEGFSLRNRSQEVPMVQWLVRRFVHQQHSWATRTVHIWQWAGAHGSVEKRQVNRSLQENLTEEQNYYWGWVLLGIMVEAWICGLPRILSLCGPKLLRRLSLLLARSFSWPMVSKKLLQRARTRSVFAQRDRRSTSFCFSRNRPKNQRKNLRLDRTVPKSYQQKSLDPKPDFLRSGRLGQHDQTAWDCNRSACQTDPSKEQTMIYLRSTWTHVSFT